MSDLPETIGSPSLLHDAMTWLRRKGNPFRQQFARNSDDSTCARYHVEALFATERQLLVDLIESFRGQPAKSTSILPVMGARGAGKTHLLHWLKHGPARGPQLFVTPGTFRNDAGAADSSSVEFVLYQLINVLLASDEQRGTRPLMMVAENVVRRLVTQMLTDNPGCLSEQMPQASGLRRLFDWTHGQRRPSPAIAGRLLDELQESERSLRMILDDLGLQTEMVRLAAEHYLLQTEPRDLKGELRKRVCAGLTHVALENDETLLADFLTDGFVDLKLAVKPTRAQLTLSLLQSLAEIIVGAGIPIVVGFDQLEELLYGQSEAEIRRSSDAFFGGLVQLMSQAPGLCVLLFAEEGLWNRIVPPLPSHILDRLHEPLEIPDHGLIRQVRLHAPTAAELAAVVACRVRHPLADYPQLAELPATFPFEPGFLANLAKQESVLRLMLQGCCHRLDELLSGARSLPGTDQPAATDRSAPIETTEAADAAGDRIEDRWGQEVRSAVRRLKPVGSLASATAELRAGLAGWLRVCKQLGVEQGEFTLDAVQEQAKVGDHPTYGSVTLAHWKSTGSRSKTLAIGLWLGRGVGKVRDLQAKLAAFDVQPGLAHLILLRPADDTRLSGKTQELFDQAVLSGKSLRIEAVDIEIFAKLAAFPKWMQQVTDLHGADAIPEEVYNFLASETQPIMQKLALPTTDRRAQAA